MPVLCQTVIDWFEAWAPPLLAEQDDRIGLQVGTAGTEIQKVLVSLEVTPEVVEEAVRERAQLIISHHPLLRDPLADLNYDIFPASLAVKLIENRIHLYVAHTNLDAAPGGVNDILAQRLGLAGVAVLMPSPQKLYKLAVFVPRGYEEAVRQAISAAGAGWIGNYSECTFQTAGWGTFRPLPGADPFLGKVGELQKVREVRLETVVPEHAMRAVVQAMLDSHPYEEVAYDVYLLNNRAGQAGLGRVGRLPEKRPLRVFAKQVRDALGLQGVRLVGDPGRSVDRVALCGGAGMALMPRAARVGAEVFVTGDVKHHDAHKALELGIAVIDAGHHGTERVVVPAMANYLVKQAAAAGERLEVVVSSINTEPFVAQDQFLESREAGPDGDPAASEQISPQQKILQQETPQQLIIHIDGASRGNPGPSGAGVVILNKHRQPLAERMQFLGSTTNNVAEYQALVLALQSCLELGADQVEIYTDSELLARQWSGAYRVQSPGLIPLMQQARQLAGRLRSCKVFHVPRERNKRADALANQAIDDDRKHRSNPSGS